LFFSIATLSWIPLSIANNFNNPLVDAADLGQKDKVLQLLKSGYKPDSKGDFDVTPLMRAAFRGNLEIVKILIDSGAFVNATDIGGETALHLAARNGYTEVVKELIENDAFIDIPDKEKWTPLMRTVMAKQLSTASYLIEQGADITAVNDSNQSVLVNAAITGKPEMIKLILGNKNFSKIPIEQQKLALAQAEKRGNEEAGRLLSSTSDYYAKKQKDTRNLANAESTGTSNTSGSISNSRANKYYEKKTPKAKPIISVKEPESENEESTSKNLNKAELNKVEQESKSIYESASRSMAKSTVPADTNPKNDDNFYDDTFYTMQLGSFPNEEKASDIWNNLQEKNQDILGKLRPDVLLVKSTSNGTYYLRSGHYRWKDIAEASCSSLRTRNIDCIVVPGSINQYDISNRGYAKSPAPTKQIAATEKPIAEKPLKTTKPASPYSPTDLAGTTPQYNERQVATNTTEDLPWLQSSKGSVEQNDLPNMSNTQIPPQYQEAPSAKEPVNQQNPTPQQMRDFSKNLLSDSSKSSAQPAKKEKEYKSAYKNIEPKTDKGPVSEAVLVPDETYFANTSSSLSNENWIDVGYFGNKDMANDYADRMLRYDENLSHLQITINETSDETGNKITIHIGPASSSATETICKAANAGGLQCSFPRRNIRSNLPNTKLASAPQPAMQQTVKYWINLGTFSDSSEAEYYWTFLHEDNQDLLNNLKYDIASDSNSDFGNNAIQLRVGPFPSDSKAKQICNILRYRNVACLVQ
jgi:ankyrin repeat protein